MYDDLNLWFEKVYWYAHANLDELEARNRIRQITYLVFENENLIAMASIRPFIKQEQRESGVGHIGYGDHPFY